MLLPNENLCFNFKAAKKATEKRIVIRDVQEDEITPSAPFFVEDIAEFQIPYKCPVGNYDETLWHEPNERNNYNRCVQVSVVSQDDATIFIFFQVPQMPEYTVNNITMDEIFIGIKGKKE